MNCQSYFLGKKIPLLSVELAQKVVKVMEIMGWLNRHVRGMSL